MAFPADIVQELAANTMSFWLDRRKKAKNQNVSKKPMLDAFQAKAKERVTGGDLTITGKVKSGQGGLAIQGYEGADQLSYGNPTGLQHWRYTIKQHHIGFAITEDELKRDGIRVSDGAGNGSLEHISEGEMIRLANLFDEKLEMMGEDYDRSLDLLLHGDGASDAKKLAGVMSVLSTTPTTGTTGGLSRALNTWWRNRSFTGGSAITSSVANGGALIQFLQKEKRLRTRFAGGPAAVTYYAGSDWIGAYETELRANGNYSMNGFRGEQDAAMGGLKFDGDPIVWDPTLDDLSLSKRAIAIDHKAIRLEYMQGGREVMRSPTRPYDRYVYYRALTSDMALVADRLNTSGIYDIA